MIFILKIKWKYTDNIIIYVSYIIHKHEHVKWGPFSSWRINKKLTPCEHVMSFLDNVQIRYGLILRIIQCYGIQLLVQYHLLLFESHGHFLTIKCIF